jgi:hypothetical protein
MTVGAGSIVFTVASWAFVLAVWLLRRTTLDGPISNHDATIGAILIVIIPDALAAWWIFRRLNIRLSRSDARRAATAFAVSAPLVLGVGYLLGELVGGYAETILGSRFILPAVASFIIVLMIVLPSAVVMWVLHPSGGVEPVPESDQDEHC